MKLPILQSCSYERAGSIGILVTAENNQILPGDAQLLCCLVGIGSCIVLIQMG